MVFYIKVDSLVYTYLVSTAECFEEGFDLCVEELWLWWDDDVGDISGHGKGFQGQRLPEVEG